MRLLPPCAEFVERRKLFLGVLSQGLIVVIVVTAAVVVGDKVHAAGAWQAPAIFLWSIGLALAVAFEGHIGGEMIHGEGFLEEAFQEMVQPTAEE